MEETKKKTRIINIMANENNPLKSIISITQALTIELYIKNIYIGYMTTSEIKNVELLDDLKQIYITTKTSGLFVDAVHIVDVEFNTITYYTMKEDLFYEQKM